MAGVTKSAAISSRVFSINIVFAVFILLYAKQMCLCCSAGAGRTGTFIALSNILERVKAEGLLDVFQAVNENLRYEHLTLCHNHRDQQKSR